MGEATGPRGVHEGSTLSTKVLSGLRRWQIGPANTNHANAIVRALSELVKYVLVGFPRFWAYFTTN